MMNSHPNPVDTSHMLEIQTLAEAGLEDGERLAEMAEVASDFLYGYGWCETITGAWLDWHCGPHWAIFYFQYRSPTPEASGYAWVIVGNLPPATFDAGLCPSRKSATLAYLAEMRQWVDYVRGGLEIDPGVIYVNVAPVEKWARELEWRLELIQKEIETW